MIADSDLEKLSTNELQELNHKVTRLIILKSYSIKIVKPTNELAKQSF